MNTLQAGAAKVVITPPVGTQMAGYGARHDVSQGIHDDLHAKAIVFDNGETQLALVTMDLIGMDPSSYAQVRADIEAHLATITARLAPPAPINATQRGVQAGLASRMFLAKP